MRFDDPLPFSEIPRCVVAFAADYPNGFRIAPHRHSRAQFVYAVEGLMTVDTEAGHWIVPPQRGVWVPAATEHAIVMHGAVRMRSLYVTPEAVPRLPSTCRVMVVRPLLRELILRAATFPRLYDESGPEGRIVDLIIDELQALPAVSLHLPWPADRRLSRITDALLADPGDGRNLVAWARVAGASPRTLARLFPRETGLPFRAWRQRARLMRALADLAEGKPVTGVALDLGYNGPSAFIAAFRREFGTSPARYVRDRPDA